LPGNAGHIGHRLEKYDFLVKGGYSVFFVEFRGFGLNGGRITEDGLYQDVQSVHDWLSQQGYDNSQIILYGESLGSAVAVDLAWKTSQRDNPFAGIILEAPFASMPDMAQHRFWYFPARWLVRYRFDSAKKITSTRFPVLVIH